MSYDAKQSHNTVFPGMYFPAVINNNYDVTKQCIVADLMAD